MPRFDYAQLTQEQRRAIIDPLVEAVHAMKTKEELREFLSRLLTASEMVMIGRRLQIAEHLIQGESYETIREKTKVGFSTIQAVDSWLVHIVRDYHEIRSKQRREAAWQKAHEQRLKFRPRHRSIHWLLIDLLREAIAEEIVHFRASQRRSAGK